MSPTTTSPSTAPSERRAAAYRAFLELYALSPAGPRGFSEPQLELLRGAVRRKTVLLLAFPPKAGGTFLRELLGTYLTLHGGNGTSTALLRGSFLGGGDQERDLYFPELLTHFLSTSDAPALLHNHPTASEGNLDLIALFGMRPIVMKRAIPDMLRSLYDACRKRGTMGGFGSGFAEDETFFALPLEDQKDFLIHNVAPWYVKFYASWYLAAQRGTASNVLFTSFESFRANPTHVAAEILAHNGIEARPDLLSASHEHCQAVRSGLRYHRGVSGRGAGFFTPEHHAHLRRLVRTYSHVDFEAEGLLPAERDLE